MIISFYSIQTKSNKRHFHFNIRNAKRLFIFVPSWYIFFISCASVYEVTFYTLSFSTKTYSSPVKIKISITKMESAFFVSLVSLHCISFCRENYNYDFHIVFTCISFDMQFFSKAKIWLQSDTRYLCNFDKGKLNGLEKLCTLLEMLQEICFSSRMAPN